MKFEFKVTHITIGAYDDSMVTVINPDMIKLFKKPKELRFIISSIVLFEPGDLIELTVDKETLIITLSHNDNEYGEVKIL